MSFVTQFGFTGFGIKRCNLFGHADTVPLTLIRCGIVSFIRFRTPLPVESYDEFLRANMSLQDFLALKRPQVRARLRAEVHKAKRQAQTMLGDDLRHWREAYQDQHGRAAELQQRVLALETTIKTLSGITQPTENGCISPDESQANESNAAQPGLTTGQILSLVRRSNMTDDEALQFGRAIESAVLAELPTFVAGQALDTLTITLDWDDGKSDAIEVHGTEKMLRRLKVWLDRKRGLFHAAPQNHGRADWTNIEADTLNATQRELQAVLSASSD